MAKTVSPSSIASEFKLLWESLLAYLIVKRENQYTPEQKALIAKREAEQGVVRYLKPSLAFEIL